MKFWYVSKYAGHPEYSSYLRHYYISKYLQKTVDGNVTLIFSRSSILRKLPDVKGHFRELQTDGFNQIILNGQQVGMGFNLKRIWSWFYFEWQFIRYAMKMEEKPSWLMVSSLSVLTFLSGVLIKKLYGCRLIIEVRDIYPLTLTELGGFKKTNPFIRFLQWIEKMAYNKADIIVSTLFNHAEHVKQICPGAEIKCSYIPMGFDPESDKLYNKEKQRLEKHQLRNKLEGKFIVGYVGSFGISQATQVIFDAIAEMNQNRDIVFLLVGSGPDKQKGLKKIENCSNFINVERVPADEVQYYIGLCDILLNPWLNKPIYRFGVSPNKWIDYMRGAKPFIVGLENSDPILQASGCSFSIEPENASQLIETILKISKMNPKELKEMGLKGRNYLENKLSYSSHANTLSKLMSKHYV